MLAEASTILRMSTTPTTATLPATLALGATHLVVRDLDRAVAWYQEALGLRVHTHEPTEAELGDGEVTTVVLHEDAQARPAGRTAGLYHYALLYPTRAELARAAVRLASTRTPIQGASTHATHEAIYLADADGNGIELAADFPRDAWGTLEDEMRQGGPQPLDFDDLVGEIAGEAAATQVAPGLRTGHLHLHVGSIADGLAFYRDVLGLEVQAELPSAVFASAGGYHHHLGFNVWRGEGVPPVPPHVAGLREWTMLLAPDEVAVVRARVEAAGLAVEALDDGFAVADPWGMRVAVRAA